MRSISATVFTYDFEQEACLDEYAPAQVSGPPQVDAAWRIDPKADEREPTGSPDSTQTVCE